MTHQLRHDIGAHDDTEVMGPVPEPFGQAILAAIEILADGKPRTASEILDEALARKLVHPGMKAKYVETSLLQYITRTLGYGRKPFLVRDLDLRFRLNEPKDDWPDLAPPAPPPAVDAATQALLDRLEQTATGKDPAAFEIAVCDAFAHMGFLATHLGARSQPDGYADAPLGALGYRVMLKCKTVVAWHGTATDPDCVEASKFKDQYHGDYCTLIAPSFPEEQELTSELQTHGVTAMTVGDLQTLLMLEVNALELREILKPGYAFDFLGDLKWARAHGMRKRIATAAQIIRSEGWKMQVTSAHENAVKDAARLTIDAAMMLVDAELERYGSSEACTREDVTAAFTHLTDPLIGAATWTDAGRNDVAILSPAST